MTTSMQIKTTEKFEITAYKRPKDIKRLRQTHVSFTGSPRKHPLDPHKIILLGDAYKQNTFYYEFLSDDIAYVEELPNIVNINEEVIAVVRIWVRKGSVGLRCTPFWVEAFE